MREETLTFDNGRGDRLSGVLHHPESDLRGAVILCHGMESSKNSPKLVLMAEELARRGILALRFDFACAGASSGKLEELTCSGEAADLRAAYDVVAGRHSGKTAIFGSSLGGTVALMFAAREPSIAALATLAAPVHPERFPARLLSKEQLERWRERGFILFNGQRMNASLLHDLECIDIPSCARRVTCPTLILHGDADAVVPLEEAHELYNCLPMEKKLSILPGGDHRLSDPQLMRRAVSEAIDWLTGNLTDKEHEKAHG
jgi:predicted alpha/beta-hydrolase family hydrolase